MAERTQLGRLPIDEIDTRLLRINYGNDDPPPSSGAAILALCDAVDEYRKRLNESTKPLGRGNE